VYAALLDRSAHLKYAKIISLDRGKGYGNDGWATLKCIIAERTWKNEWEIQKNGKLVTLSFCDRTLAVPAKYVAPQARELLIKAAHSYIGESLADYRDV